MELYCGTYSIEPHGYDVPILMPCKPRERAGRDGCLTMIRTGSVGYKSEKVVHLPKTSQRDDR